MNEYDSLRAYSALASEGYILTSNIAHADVIFLNTCSVREKAEQKVYSFLGRLRRLKARHPRLKIVVAGCLAQQLGKELLERFDHLDLVIGTRGIPATALFVDKLQRTDKRIAYLPEQEPKSDPKDFCSRSRLKSAFVAPVTIMQGCDNFCTYCIVPYVRGRERSRPSREILEEVEMLVDNGAREILLLGQNVNSYGRGLNERISFAELLHRIHAVPRVSRIRYTTSHPKDLTDDMIKCFRELPRLCKNLHLPFQAGSDRVLRRMNRGYTSPQYLEKIDRLREMCPDIGLSSDALVGFPGETEEDYQDTLRLLETVQFDGVFSFRYSDRPYTESAKFPDKIDERTKARRLTELQGLQAGISLKKNLAERGKVREVMVEGPSKASNGQLTGRTHQNRIVNFDGPRELAGRSISVRIVSAFSHSLRGELLPDVTDGSLAHAQVIKEASCSDK